MRFIGVCLALVLVLSLVGCKTQSSSTGVVFKAYEAVLKEDLNSFRALLAPQSEAEAQYSNYEEFKQLTEKAHAYSEFDLESERMIKQVAEDFDTKVTRTYSILVGGKLANPPPNYKPPLGYAPGWDKALQFETICVEYRDASYCRDTPYSNYSPNYSGQYQYNQYSHSWEECKISKLILLRK